LKECTKFGFKLGSTTKEILKKCHVLYTVKQLFSGACYIDVIVRHCCVNNNKQRCFTKEYKVQEWRSLSTSFRTKTGLRYLSISCGRNMIKPVLWA